MNYELRDDLVDLQLERDIALKVARLAALYDCNTYLVAYANPLSFNGVAWFIDNYPTGDWENVDTAKRDPLLDILKGPNPQAQPWDATIYIRAGASDIWENASAAGLHAGIVAPVRPGGGRRMLISLTRDKDFDGNLERLNKQAENLGRDADMIAGAVIDLFDTRVDYELKLSDGDREILKWVFDVVPVALIAQKTNIPQKILVHRLGRIVEKLGVGSPMQAAMMAARYGAIQ